MALVVFGVAATWGLERFLYRAQGAWTSALPVAVAVVLAVLTGYYVRFTKQLVDAQRDASAAQTAAVVRTAREGAVRTYADLVVRAQERIRLALTLLDLWRMSEPIEEKDLTTLAEVVRETQDFVAQTNLQLVQLPPEVRASAQQKSLTITHASFALREAWLALATEHGYARQTSRDPNLAGAASFYASLGRRDWDEVINGKAATDAFKALDDLAAEMWSYLYPST